MMNNIGDDPSPAFVDIDGDNDFDAFVGEFNGNINYYENTTTGSEITFKQRTGTDNPFDGVDVGSYSSPAFVDIDGDDDFDAFVGERDGNINYFENTTTGSEITFEVRTGTENPFDGVDVGYDSKPTFVDIDGDNDFDVFIGERDGIIKYYENTTTGSEITFEERTGTDNPLDGVDVGSISSPTFVDIDGDNDFDAFIGESDGYINYYENTTTGSEITLVEQTGTDNPLDGVDVGYRSSPTFVDIDGDNDFDVYIGTESGNIYYYKNICDAVPPEFVTGFPRVDNIDQDSIDVMVQLNEPGKAYYVIVADEETPPSVEEVKAGTGAGSGTPIASGSIDVTESSVDFSSSVNDLVYSTSYDLYVVAEDDEDVPNVQSSVTKLDFTIKAVSHTNTPPTAPELVSPAHGSTGVDPSTVEFTWNNSTDDDGDEITYKLYLDQDPNFTNTDPIDIAQLLRTAMEYAGLGGLSSGLLFLLTLFAGLGCRRKYRKIGSMLIVMLATVTLMLSSFSGCGGGGKGGSSDDEEIIHEVTDLDTGATYYWKVVASDNNGGETESEVWSFTTE